MKFRLPGSVTLSRLALWQRTTSSDGSVTETAATFLEPSIYSKERPEDDWIENDSTINYLDVGPKHRKMQMLGRLRSQSVASFLLGNEFMIVHYSASSLDSTQNGNQRICSINVLRYPDDTQFSFSIVAAAEHEGVSESDIHIRLNELEEVALREFVSFVTRFSDKTFVYYSYGEGFGINAIFRRAKKLGIDTSNLQPAKTVNLYFLTWPFFGGKPPRSSIEVLFRRNGILPQRFLTGQQEADHFSMGRFRDVCDSTSVKTRMFLYVIIMMRSRRLISPNKSIARIIVENLWRITLQFFTSLYEHPLRKGGTTAIVIITIAAVLISFVWPDFSIPEWLGSLFRTG